MYTNKFYRTTSVSSSGISKLRMRTICWVSAADLGFPWIRHHSNTSGQGHRSQINMGSSSSTMCKKPCSKCTIPAARNLDAKSLESEISSDIKQKYQSPVKFRVSVVTKHRSCHVRILLEDLQNSGGFVIHVLNQPNQDGEESRPKIECLREEGFSSQHFSKLFTCELNLIWKDIITTVWKEFEAAKTYNLVTNNCQHFARRVKNRFLAIKSAQEKEGEK